MKKKILKQIVIDKQNYDGLKNLGRAGESFNDVISKLIKVDLLQGDFHKTINNTEVNNMELVEEKLQDIELKHCPISCDNCNQIYVNKYTNHRISCRCKCHTSSTEERK